MSVTHVYFPCTSLKSGQNAGASIDLGATWFWAGERHIEGLVQELGTATHPHYIHGDALYHDKPSSQRIRGNPIDVESSRFTNSAASLTEALANQLPPESLHLSSPVRSIQITDTNAQVEYQGDGGTHSVSAQHIVLALPPALAAHHITFDPPLPDNVASVARQTSVWMGSIAKVVVVYDKPFWREQGLAGAAMSHLGPVREFHDISGPTGSPAAIFGFAPVAQGSKAPTESQVVAQMQELLGREGGTPKEVIIKDWSNEEYTSPPGVQALGSSRMFGHPVFQGPTVGGRLHWSSTETDKRSPGHIDGAIAAAKRTVQSIVSASKR